MRGMERRGRLKRLFSKVWKVFGRKKVERNAGKGTLMRFNISEGHEPLRLRVSEEEAT